MIPERVLFVPRIIVGGVLWVLNAKLYLFSKCILYHYKHKFIYSGVACLFIDYAMKISKKMNSADVLKFTCHD